MTPIGNAGRDFVVRFRRMSTAVERGRKDTIVAASLAAKKVHADTIRKDTGDSRLSGVGKRGAKVGARFDMKRPDRAEVKATGPLHFVAHPMSPHRIPKARGERARKRYAVIPGVGVRAYANHPGTKGKNTWNKATRKAQSAATRELQRETRTIIKRAFQ